MMGCVMEVLVLLSVPSTAVVNFTVDAPLPYPPQPFTFPLTASAGRALRLY